MPEQNEEDDWISVQTAKNMLARGMMTIYHWKRHGKLQTRGSGRQMQIRLKDIERELKNHKVMQWIEARERNKNVRNFAPVGDMPPDAIPLPDACRLLNISEVSFISTLDQGNLKIYAKEIQRGYWFSVEEVLKYKIERDARKERRLSESKQRSKERDDQQMESHELALRRKRTVDILTLTPEEKYFSQMMTTRQVAAKLRITPVTVARHRKRGSIKGFQLEAAPDGSRTWLYWREEVEKLWNSPAYNKKRNEWETYVNPKNPKAEANRQALKIEQMEQTEALETRRTERQKKALRKARENEDNETRRAREASEWVKKSKTLAWEMRHWRTVI